MVILSEKQKTRDPEIVEFSGAFFPNGNGVIDNALNRGDQVVAARANDGVYSITLPELTAAIDGRSDIVRTLQYVELVSATVTLHALTTVGHCFLVRDAIAASRQVRIDYMEFDDGVPEFASVDLAAAATTMVCWTLRVRVREATAFV